MKRVLSFKAEGQSLAKDSNCSFEGIVSGTKGYLVAKFSYDSIWKGCAKVAVFRRLLEEYPVVIVKDTCCIPSEVLDWDKFSVKLVGQRKDGFRLTTNEVEITQEMGGAIV